MGGQLTAQNRQPRGARFILTLPEKSSQVPEPALVEKAIHYPEAVMDSAFVAEEIREGVPARKRRKRRKRRLARMQRPKRLSKSAKRLLDEIFGPTAQKDRTVSSLPRLEWEDEGIEPTYARRENSDVWHWCWDCSKYPRAGDLVMRQEKPSSGRFCKECQSKTKRGNCRG